MYQDEQKICLNDTKYSSPAMEEPLSPHPPPRLQMDEVINNNLSIYLPVSPFCGIQNVLLPTEIFSSGQSCDLMRFNDKQNYHD